MAKRNWVSTIAFGLIAIALMALIGWKLVERDDKRQGAYNAAYQQYESTKGRQAPGARIEGESSVADPKAYREEWRAEKDLEAQREMAEWAFYMMLASFAGVAVTTIGLVYVARTLKTSRDALVETQEVTRQVAEQTGLLQKEFLATHRPRLVLRKAFSRITDPLEDNITIFYTITNIGDSACWIIHSHIGIQFVEQTGYPHIRPPLEVEFPDNPVHIGSIAPGEVIKCVLTDRSQQWDHAHRTICDGELGVYFAGEITYLDAPQSDIQRQMGFRRKYDIDRQCFVRTESSPPEDEYSD